jgi:hypothetical protein
MAPVVLRIGSPAIFTTGLSFIRGPTSQYGTILLVIVYSCLLICFVAFT